MIARILATTGAVIPIAAAIDTTRGHSVDVSTPTIWHFLGYQFEAGSMIAGLCACAAVRFYVVQKDFQRHLWRLDAPISLLVLMFTAAATVRLRPDPAMALVYGTGLGILGAGIITIAKKNVDRMLAAMGMAVDESAPPEPSVPKPDPDQLGGIGAALRQLDVPPNP